MATQDKKISELIEIQNLKGTEFIPLQDNNTNTKIKTDKIATKQELNIVKKDIDSIKAELKELQNISGDYCISIYKDNQIDPEPIAIKGNQKFALDWYPWLVDMTDNYGPTVTKARTLKKNNWFRYATGEFAPAVCISKQDWALCDVELYLDAEHTRKYCEALTFNAEDFYNNYGMTQKLYTSTGEEISHIRRPWETKNKDLGQFIGRKDTIYLCDQLIDNDNNVIKGIFANTTNYNGITFDKYKLPPTGISPHLNCTIGDKTRSFFYLMPGEVDCQSSNGRNDYINILTSGKHTYPRINMGQKNNMNFARANNRNITGPTPFAESGYFAFNTFISCMEIGYGTKNLNINTKFSNGVTPRNPCDNENEWKLNGGVRTKKQNTSIWEYCSFGQSANLGDDINEVFTYIFNQAYPTICVNEAQIAASYAAELNIQPNEEFKLYDTIYYYNNVDGATSLLDGEMNCRLYKKLIFTVNATENKKPQIYDCEVILRVGLIQGVNLCGETYGLYGGGYEQVGYEGSSTDPKTGYDFSIFIQPNQKKWVYETKTHNTIDTKFSFEDTYIYLGKYKNPGDGFVLKRVPYTIFPLITKNDQILRIGECCFSGNNKHWGIEGYKTRVENLSRGYILEHLSTNRYSSFWSSIDKTISFVVGGSTQVLLGGIECNII